MARLHDPMGFAGLANRRSGLPADISVAFELHSFDSVVILRKAHRTDSNHRANGTA